MANRYLVSLKYLVNFNSHSNFKFECEIKFISYLINFPPTIINCAPKVIIHDGCHMLREQATELCLSIPFSIGPIFSSRDLRLYVERERERANGKWSSACNAQAVHVCSLSLSLSLYIYIYIYIYPVFNLYVIFLI
jgi:hypothetical protein